MTYRIEYHPEINGDLRQIALWLVEKVGEDVAEAKLDTIVAGIAYLEHTPHIGTLRNEIALGLRAIPIGENAVVAFTVHEDTREVMIFAVTWGGADWMGRSRRRVR